MQRHFGNPSIYFHFLIGFEVYLVILPLFVIAKANVFQLAAIAIDFLFVKTFK